MKLENILLGIVGSILIASIGFFGASILDSIKKVNDDTVEIKLIKRDIDLLIKNMANVEAALIIHSSDKSIDFIRTDIEVLKTRIANLEEE